MIKWNSSFKINKIQLKRTNFSWPPLCCTFNCDPTNEKLGESPGAPHIHVEACVHLLYTCTFSAGPGHVGQVEVSAHLSFRFSAAKMLIMLIMNRYGSLSFMIQEGLILHSFSKETQHFWKLPFFWRRVYTSESGVNNGFDNAHGNNLPICRFPMIQGHMTLNLDPRKNPWRKVAFLLRLSVVLAKICPHSCNEGLVYIKW